MAPDPRIGSTLGDYTIESLLGRGGMSVVYLARHTKLDRHIALKVMAEELSENEGFRSRFVREAKMAANLEHPNIVPVYDAGEIDGVLYLAMRVIRGTDLRRVISEDGPMDPERTLTMSGQVASALDAAHRAGLVHRDVKPGNILLAFDGDEEHSFLSDFGLTKHVSSKSGLTKTGTFLGTVDYVAPEQIRGLEVDGRTDEYSLGCVVYECLTGDVPFTKDQDVATLFAHVEQEPPRVSATRPDVPEGVSDAVARAMSKRKEGRSAGDRSEPDGPRPAAATSAGGSHGSRGRTRETRSGDRGDRRRGRHRRHRRGDRARVEAGRSLRAHRTTDRSDVRPVRGDRTHIGHERTERTFGERTIGHDRIGRRERLLRRHGADDPSG